jgi:hypothetical protein
MQQAYIARISGNGVSRFIFTGSLYQAQIFMDKPKAISWLPHTPARLQFRDGSSFTIDNFRIEQVPEGWIIACRGPFDFAETQMLEAMQTA